MPRTSEHTREYLIEQERQSIVHFSNLARIAGEKGDVVSRSEYLGCVTISEHKIDQLKALR